MKILLDTHIFLWYVSADPRLPHAYRVALEDTGNEVFLSVASIWESVVKFQLGKLPLPEAAATYLPRQRELHGIASLAIGEGVMTALASLPPLHRDPFERLIVAQAIEQQLTIASVDPAMRAYGAAFLPVD